jgi:hypothetical protein
MTKNSSPSPNPSTEPTPAQRLIRELKEKRPDAARAIVAELNRRIEARKRAEAA